VCHHRVARARCAVVSSNIRSTRNAKRPAELPDDNDPDESATDVPTQTVNASKRMKAARRKAVSKSSDAAVPQGIAGDVDGNGFVCARVFVAYSVVRRQRQRISVSKEGVLRPTGPLCDAGVLVSIIYA